MRPSANETVPGTSAMGATEAPEYQEVDLSPISTTSAPSSVLTKWLTFSGKNAPASSRANPSASLRSITEKRSPWSIHLSGAWTYSG